MPTTSPGTSATMSSKPRDIQRNSSGLSNGAASSPALSVQSNKHSRRTSIARLGSPIPSRPSMSENPTAQGPSSSHSTIDNAELSTMEDNSPRPGPGRSALSSALANTSRDHSSVPAEARNSLSGIDQPERNLRSKHGSFEARDLAGSPIPVENHEIIKRHLVHYESNGGLRIGLQTAAAEPEPAGDSEGFSSLQLQGGDVTREIYRWAEDADQSLRGRAKRSQSFNLARPPPDDETLDKKNILMPGGFRRNFLRRAADSPAPSVHGRNTVRSQDSQQGGANAPRRLFTNNFLEFLTLYGHFAGADLEEDDEALEPDEYFSSHPWDGQSEGYEPGERSALLTPGTPAMRRRKPKERASKGTGSQTNATLLLLKSFVGTGVLFLPKAFMNGGMLFSSLMLLAVGFLSLYCFLLLLDTRAAAEGSFADMGNAIIGKWFRTLILVSLVISQMGFGAAYTVFTATNLQAFVLAVTDCKTFLDIKYVVLLQLVVLLPVSLIRDIGKLGFTALIADVFILFGLIYLYYYDIFTLAVHHGIADITLFNPDSWTLLIGTAIFAFEGVGLVIPVQESMARPDKFPKVLTVVTIICVVIFTSIAVLSYAAYGSETQTVVLLNLPQESRLVNTLQFLYALAILLSTPLQLFPAIRIIETEFFTRSGKYNPSIKWQKNVFRFAFVILIAFIAWGGANDLDKFVSLTGSFACLPLLYVYPPLMHYKAVAKRQWQRIVDIIIIVVGMVGMVYTSTLTLQQWSTKPPDNSSGYCSPKQ